MASRGPSWWGLRGGARSRCEVAINWPKSVDSLVLISSTYDKPQLLRLKNMKRPTLIIWAEDNLVAQLKAGYLLRDSIRTAWIEVLGAVAKNPNYDFTIAHKLERYKKDVIISLIRDFLASPSEKIAEPPELEPELKGLAMKEQKEEESYGRLPRGHSNSFLLVLLLYGVAVGVA